MPPPRPPIAPCRGVRSAICGRTSGPGTRRRRTRPSVPAFDSAGCAGCRPARACWPWVLPLLHLVEHGRERVLELQRLLDFVRAHIRVLAVLEKARPVVIADELDERGRVRLPVLGKPLQVFEDRIDAVLREERHGIL